jgi:hypothetical protein
MLETGSKARLLWGWFLVRALLLACRQLPSCWVLMGFSVVHMDRKPLVSLFLHIRTSILLD